MAIIVFYLVPTPKKSFEELYHGDASIAENLMSFRQFPLKTVEVNGVQWNYYDSGENKEVILFLHGMGGAYDIWFQQLQKMKKDFRVISVTYPAVNSLDELSDGIIDILNREKIEKVNIIGTSLGGYLTQFLLKNYPKRLNKIIIANSFPPNGLYRSQNAGKGKVLPFVPEWLLMKMFGKNIEDRVVPAANGNQLVKAYLIEQASGLMSKKQFVGRFHCVMQDFIPPDPEQIKNRILIIESDNDPLVPKVLRDSLKLTYPMAKVFTFHNTGHFTYLNQPDIYTDVITNFFSDQTMKEKKQIENLIENYYFKGRKDGNVDLLGQAFMPEALLATVQNGDLVTGTLAEYLKMVNEKGSVKCVTSLLNISVQGSIAIVETSFDYGPVVYNDYLSLVKENESWRISYKLYTKLD